MNSFEQTNQTQGLGQEFVPGIRVKYSTTNTCTSLGVLERGTGEKKASLSCCFNVFREGFIRTPYNTLLILTCTCAGKRSIKPAGNSKLTRKPSRPRCPRSPVGTWRGVRACGHRRNCVPSTDPACRHCTKCNNFETTHQAEAKAQHRKER